MNRSLFTHIVQDLSANCPYFQEGCDAVGKVGISALVKCTSAIRQLAYATVPDSLDEYLQNRIDCTKWSWAQCPQAYRAQFSRGDSGSEPFILLETVALQDLWIWHAFFGVAGSHHPLPPPPTTLRIIDVNVFTIKSPVLNDLKEGKAPEVPFMANDVTYK
ncbi:putative nuclease HARBI1 [Tanacetum coccineum]